MRACKGLDCPPVDCRQRTPHTTPHPSRAAILPLTSGWQNACFTYLARYTWLQLQNTVRKPPSSVASVRVHVWVMLELGDCCAFFGCNACAYFGLSAQYTSRTHMTRYCGSICLQASDTLQIWCIKVCSQHCKHISTRLFPPVISTCFANSGTPFQHAEDTCVPPIPTWGPTHADPIPCVLPLLLPTACSAGRHFCGH